MPNLVAVRSLQCADHAENIPPRVLSVLWNLTKRCNYDCSYCSPHVHDAVSPFVNTLGALKFAQAFQTQTLERNQRIKWAFTGGEPFLDPSFFDIVQSIIQFDNVEQINATTNGTMPLQVYEKFVPYLAGITFSLHLERSQTEIQSTVEKILYLTNKHQDCWISVNLMFLPGLSKQIKSIIEIFQQHQVKFVLRKITPHVVDVKTLPWLSNAGTGRKNKQLLDLATQSSNKLLWQEIRDTSKEVNEQGYYSDSELEMLKLYNQDTTWTNMAFWDRDLNYKELNSDELRATSQHQFQGWTCWAGVDSLFVDFDGRVYRGWCQDGGAVGHINSMVDFLQDPHVCGKKWCECNFDMPVRKCASADFQSLVSPN